MKGEFGLLRRAEMEKIHGDAVEVLSRVGLAVEAPQAVRALQQRGARVKGGRVLLRPEWIEECVALAGESGGGGPGLSHVRTGCNANRGFTPFVRDAGGAVRAVEEADLSALCRAVDGISHLDTLFLPVLGGGDGGARAVEIALSASGKHILAPCLSQAGARALCALHSGAPGRITALVPAGDPLRLDPTAAGALAQLAGGGAAAGVVCPLPGVYGSAGIRELLLLGHLLNLGALALLKAVNADAPFLYAGFSQPCETPLGLTRDAPLELGFVACGQAQLADAWGIPSLLFCDHPLWSGEGGVHGFRGCVAYQALLQMTRGGIFAWVGSLEQGACYSLEKITLDSAVLSMTKAHTRRFATGREKCAADVVRQVGPGGHFLSHSHTLGHFRDELWTKKTEAEAFAELDWQ